MSLLSMVEAQLPPGFRFHPRDDELICEYLAPRVAGDSSRRFSGCQMLIEIDLNKCEPWDLPEMASVGGKEWYFFSLKDRKYATGQRTNRATVSGYWKATGKDKAVVRKGQLIGMRKTLVFYQGRAPKGKNTDWVMHEFRLENSGHPPKPSFKEDWVLCRIFYKTRGISPKPSTHTSSHKNTGSPTLPNLAGNYVTFDQTLPNLEGFEQVPCFSNFPVNPELPPQYFPIVERDLSQLAHVGGLPDLGSCLNPSMSLAEKKMFSKLRGNQRVEGNRSVAEEGSESFMSGLSVPSVWRSPSDW